MSEIEQNTRINDLERRVASLESIVPARTTLSRLCGVLRYVAWFPVLALPFFILIQLLADYGELPFGIVCLGVWVCIVVLWLFLEVLIAKNRRFSLACLLLVMTISCVCFAFVRTYVYSPWVMEQATLASIDGLTKSIHREPQGPGWLRWLLSDKYFERVTQLEIKAPGGDADIPKLKRLPGLRCVFLTGTNFTNDGVEAITALPDTAQVILTRTSVTPEALERVRSMRPNMEIVLQ